MMMDPLSISTGAAAGEDGNPDRLDSNSNNINENNDSSNETPLEQKILEIVKGCPKNDNHEYIVRPARLSAELGISIEDATAELCGLLAAVGGGHDGASFVFETTTTPGSDDTAILTKGGVSTMVFHFPLDFEKRAKSNRRKEDFKLFAWETLLVIWKGIKILTAFGLILSLLILTIAAMAGIIAAIVAMSTNNNNRQQGGGGHHGRAVLIRQLRLLFYTVRQLLWCYAVWGDHDGRDPFLSETAYDISLLMSICCVNPGSFFWWWRVQQLNRRRRYNRRGWGTRRAMLWNTNNRGGGRVGDDLETDVEGVRLLRRGDWGHQEQQHQRDTLPSSPSSEEQRGLLSIAVEYLFGPTPFQPGPTEADIWKLRGAALVQLLALNASLDTPGVSLQQLSPYMDNPPSSLDSDIATIVAGGLEIVSHFNGVPAAASSSSNNNNNKDPQSTAAAAAPPVPPHLARFHFPELASESHYVTRYDGQAEDQEDQHDESSSWNSILCLDSTANTPRSHRTTTRRTGESTSTGIPQCLVERRYRFTKLQTNQFLYCVFLGSINLIGVLWLRSSLEPPNGILQLKDGTFLASVLKKGLVPVLYFYAVLFFVLPAGRLLLILILNNRRKQRNQRRRTLASGLPSLS